MIGGKIGSKKKKRNLKVNLGVRKFETEWNSVLTFLEVITAVALLRAGTKI